MFVYFSDGANLCRWIHFSSRAGCAFPALPLNDVHVPHTRLVFHVVCQRNRTQGCTGHIIIKYYSYPYSNLLPLLSGLTLGSFLLVSIFMRPDLQLWKSQWHSLQNNSNVSISQRLYFCGLSCSNIGEHYPLDKSPSSGFISSIRKTNIVFIHGI